MRLEDMSDIQTREMVMRWDIEAERSYLRSLLDGAVYFDTTDVDYDFEIAASERRLLETEVKHYKFVRTHAEHFI